MWGEAKSRGRTFVGRGPPPPKLTPAADWKAGRSHTPQQEGHEATNCPGSSPLWTGAAGAPPHPCWGPKTHQQTSYLWLPRWQLQIIQDGKTLERPDPRQRGQARCRKLTPCPWEAAEKPLLRNRRSVCKTLVLHCTHLDACFTENLPGPGASSVDQTGTGTPGF